MKSVKLSTTQSIGLKALSAQYQAAVTQVKQAEQVIVTFLTEVITEAGEDPALTWNYDDKTDSLTHKEPDASNDPKPPRPRLVDPAPNSTS